VLKNFLTPPPAGGSELLRQLHHEIDELADVRDRLERAIADEPPALATDPGMIRSGYHAGLDELRDLSQHSKQIIAAMEERERKRTGIGSLKIRFNQIFGYYIEISKANLHLAPADYERKQTLVNAERFTSSELKEYERKILAAMTASWKSSGSFLSMCVHPWPPKPRACAIPPRPSHSWTFSPRSQNWPPIAAILAPNSTPPGNSSSSAGAIL